MKKKIIGFILAQNEYKSFVNQNKLLINALSKQFDKVYILNLVRLRFHVKNKDVINQEQFPDNYILSTPNNSSEFLNFFKDKEMIGIQYLSKTPNFFKIFYLIKKVKIKNIMIMNLGNFGNKQSIELQNIKFFKAFKYFYRKGFYYPFRLFTIFNIFPKIEILFESNNDIIENIKNGLSRKVENLFPFFKISYFRKVIRVNSVAYDHLLQNKETLEVNSKKILYVDTPLNHPDRNEREGKLNDFDVKNFYAKLTNFLEKMSKTFDRKILICPHPSNKKELKYFQNFEISKKSTIDEIPTSDIIIFTLSSAILPSIIYKKKIINLESQYLGKYLNNFRIKYCNSLNLFSINIDNNVEIKKEYFLEKMNNSIEFYDDFIKSKLCSDKNISSTSKIIQILKKDFF